MTATAARDEAVRPRRPFQGMTGDNWLNLAAAGVIAFYLIQILLDFAWGTICGHAGVDFCNGIWSPGQIANTAGYAHLYDLDLISKVERGIYPQSADPSLFIATPGPYLPVFVPPFQALALLPPTSGYAIWSLLNISAMLAYLVFFTRRMTGSTPSPGLLLLLCASLPVFFNVFYGNVNVWLMICAGESIRALHADRPVVAGLWLGGLILKPPLLAVVAILLLLAWAWRVVAGLIATSLAAFGASLLMIGWQPLLNMVAIWRRSAAGNASDGVESMMNWRMLATDLSRFTGNQWAWAVAILGMIVTLFLALRGLRAGLKPSGGSLWLTMITIFAAGGVLAWHSHVHTAMILLPPLLYLAQTGILPRRLISVWALLPAFLYILVLVPQYLMWLEVLPGTAQYVVFVMRGGGMLFVNMLLLWWASQAAAHRTVPA